MNDNSNHRATDVFGANGAKRRRSRSGAEMLAGRIEYGEVLDGGAGDDTLYGYGGNDTFLFGRR